MNDHMKDHITPDQRTYGDLDDAVNFGRAILFSIAGTAVAIGLWWLV